MAKRLGILLILLALLLSACSKAADKQSDDVASEPDTTMELENFEENGESLDDSGYVTGEITDTDEKIDDNENDKSVESSSYFIEKPAPSGMPVPVITEDDDGDYIPVTLYYQDADGYLVPATRMISRQEGIARASVNALVDSAINREQLEYYGLYPVLPAGTKILGLTIRDGTAIIDFSENILNYEDERDEVNIFSSVVYTLTEFDTVDDVIILINGYNDVELKFGSNISGKLNRDNVPLNAGKLNFSETTG